MPTVNYRILKLQNGDFEKVAERETEKEAIRCATYHAIGTESGTVFRVVRDNPFKVITEVVKS